MNWFKELICRIFHPIETINHCHFVDIVDGKEVGLYKCPKCNVTFMANSKRNLFRVYN